MLCRSGTESRHRASAPAEGRKRSLLLYVIAGLLVMGALWAARQAGTDRDMRMRTELARQAVAVAAAVPIDEAQALSFTIDDLERPEYSRLCAMLKAYSELTGLKSIYTMALRDDGKLVFGPESSLYPSSPGDAYLEPSGEDFLPFETAAPVVIGPFTDEYGSFVSAAAPVVHPRTGEVLFTVGIDIEAADWKAAIRRAQWIPLLSVLIPLAALLFGGVLMQRRSRTSPENARPLHHLESAVCAAITLLLALGAALFVALHERSHQADAFYSAARFKAEVYSTSFRNLTENIHMLVAFFESSEYVTAGEFRTLCKPLMLHHAIEGCVWVPEVAAKEKEAFEAEVRAGGQPGFSIRSLPDADGKEGPDTLYPALYVESVKKTDDAFGYNLASEPVRRAALMEAIQTGRLTASDAIHLAALPDAPQGLFLFLPVNAARQKGVLALVIRPDSMMQVLAGQAQSETAGMQVCLLQLPAAGPPQTLSCPDNRTAAGCMAHAPRKMQKVFPLFAFGKPYALLMTPDSEWLAVNPLSRARITLVAGLLLSGLLTTLVGILANRPRRLEQEVQKRTVELRQSEEALKESSEFMQSTLDGLTAHIALLDETGTILLVNKAWRDFAGRNGANVDTVCEGADYPAACRKADCREFTEGLQRVLSGLQNVFSMEYPCKTEEKDYWFNVCVSRFEQGGKCRAVVFHTNITKRKNAETAVQQHIDDLERFNKAAVGRELRMIELKQEINALCRELGREEPYSTQTES